ncbi:hypothetical protein GCM10010464_27180 [Pseudonocardia yunnanensis]
MDIDQACEDGIKLRQAFILMCERPGRRSPAIALAAHRNAPARGRANNWLVLRAATAGRTKDGLPSSAHININSSGPAFEVPEMPPPRSAIEAPNALTFTVASRPRTIAGPAL